MKGETEKISDRIATGRVIDEMLPSSYKVDPSNCWAAALKGCTVVKITCVYCGAEIKPNDDFCLNCSKPVVPIILHERYNLLGSIGQGGMGTIYKAEDTKLGNRFVAIKELIMPHTQTQEQFDRASRLFEQEALLLAKLSHPALPDIYDHFSQEKHWYFVMKYIPGETLAQHLLTMPGQLLSVQETLDIGIKLCEVLEYLHSQTPPIIFGDLKPQNIMLTPEGHLYLIDFGIARFFSKTPSDAENFISPGYSPPEQYQHAQLSPRSDIYSLGATLYHLLSGHNPGKGNNPFMSSQSFHQIEGKDLETLIQNMLALDDQQRPENAALVKQTLQYILTQQTPQPTIDPWETPAHSGNTSSWFSPFAPNQHSPNALSNIEPPPLPAYITSQNIRLSQSNFSSFTWSLDGIHLAAIDNDTLYIYAWPDEQTQTSLKETLTPIFWIIRSNPKNRFKVMQYPPLLSVIKIVRGNLNVLKFAWSPDGTHLAISDGRSLYKIHIFSKTVSRIFDNVREAITHISWSPDGLLIAIGYSSYPSIVEIWEINTSNKLCENQLTRGKLQALKWSENSRYIAFAGGGMLAVAPTIPAPHNNSAVTYPNNNSDYFNSDTIVQVCEANTGREICRYQENAFDVNDVLWAIDGTYIVSCGNDPTIHIWDATTALKLRSLEGHTQSVERLAFLDNGGLLVSVSSDGTVCIWNTETWMQVESFHIDWNTSIWPPVSQLAFQSTKSLMAVFKNTGDTTLYKIDVNQLYLKSEQRSGIQYTNAKVVLIGDSGVGKSGLGMVLSHQNFAPTESTHGRIIWTLSRHDNKMEDGHKEIHETLLWDLAGQPGYRLIHQLHLSEVVVALVIFDAHSETDPFAGIAHWVRALRTAQSVRGNHEAMKMLLVQARIDRGGIRVTQDRIDEFTRQLGIDGYFETSAKEGTNVAELSKAIEKAINWDKLPKVTSTDTFQRIKSFLIAEKQAERLLSTEDDLYRAFLNVHNALNKASPSEFTTGIKLLEVTGMIRRLSFGNLVLLQPELLDAYASALVNAARREPDGLGSIAEEAVNAASFPIPQSERIQNTDLEKLLLIAMVQDLLSYEIALREQGEDGPYLVFPSESIRENPDLPNPENASVIFTFEGPVLNIYATLAVRLSHAGFFSKRDLWKNAIIYDSISGGTCGIWLKLIEDGKGELTLFFDDQTGAETRLNFEDYIRVHLQRKSLPESVKSQRVFRCECGFTASEQLTRMRAKLGFSWFRCPICDSYVDLRDPKERLKPSQISEMDKSADKQRALAAAQSIIQGKQETKDFDVFLCYNPADQEEIIEIGEKLKEQGLLPWLDLWELQPGRSWQRSLEQQIGQIKSAAVFVGKDGIGPWQQRELEAFLRQFVRRECPVIPVILKEAPEQPILPIFLEGLRWVDFRAQAPSQDMSPMEQLRWGITGKRKMLR